MPFKLSTAQQEQYERDGYVILPKHFDGEEIALLQRAMEEDPAITDS